MKLNKSDREAFVRAVMDDVPQTDFKELAKKLVLDTLRADAPQYVRDLLDDGVYRLDGWCFYLPGELGNVYSGLTQVCNRQADFKEKFPVAWDQIEEFAAGLKEQSERLKALRSKLTGVINSCSTLKQAKDRLPEFEKYLPKERDATGVSGLPVVANVVADLVAMGWPKGEVAA